MGGKEAEKRKRKKKRIGKLVSFHFSGALTAHKHQRDSQGGAWQTVTYPHFSITILLSFSHETGFQGIQFIMVRDPDPDNDSGLEFHYNKLLTYLLTYLLSQLVRQSDFRPEVEIRAFCACAMHPAIKASVNWRTGVLYARKFGQNAKNQMARRTSTPKIKWPAYTYAEK